MNTTEQPTEDRSVNIGGNASGVMPPKDVPGAVPLPTLIARIATQEA